MNTFTILLKRGMRNIIIALSLLFVVLAFSIPYLWMIGSSFKPRAEIFQYIFPFTWRTFVPVSPTFHNFVELFTTFKFGSSIFLSLYIAFLTVVFSIVVCSMIAFVLAKLQFKGRTLLFFYILATLMVPFEARIVPLYLVIRSLGVDNTIAAIYLPWIADAFVIFLFRQHLCEIPKDFYDAGLIEGCTHFRVYRSLMLPMITPAIVSAILIKFIWSWDSFIWPLVVIRNPRLQVITVAISNLFSDQDILWNIVFSAAFVTTIPVLVVFFMLQKYYIAGVTSSGIKG